MSKISESDSELIETTFVKLCELDESSLTDDESVLINVYHSLGVIEGDGLHGFLCHTDINLDRLVRDYRTINVPVASESIERAVQLYRSWAATTKNEDEDSFREAHEGELDLLEEQYYGAESQIISGIAQYVRKNAGKIRGTTNK